MLGIGSMHIKQNKNRLVRVELLHWRDCQDERYNHLVIWWEPESEREFDLEQRDIEGNESDPSGVQESVWKSE